MSTTKAVCSLLLFISLNQLTVLEAQNNTNSNEARLISTLFAAYNKRVRPVQNSSLPVEVKFGIKLSKVMKVDSKSQQFTVSVWITQIWRNSFLKWNKGNVGQISSITVDPSEIWTPDVGLINNADESVSFAGGRNKFQTNVIIQDTGTCIWKSPAIFTSDCDIQVRFWPFDTQICQMKFSSFTMTKSTLTLVLIKQMTTKTDQFVTSSGWKVENMEILKNDDSYSCCIDTFSVVGFKLRLKRKPTYFVLNLIIPSFILCVLSLLSFIIPSESGERIGFITTIMLAMTVYLLVIADRLPETSEQIPLTGLVFVLTIAQNAFILLATIIVLRCFHGTGDPPAWLQRFYCCCCPCFGKTMPPRKTNRIKASSILHNEVALKELVTPDHIPAVFDQNDSKEFDTPTWQDIAIFLNRFFFVLSFILIAAMYIVTYLVACFG